MIKCPFAIYEYLCDKLDCDRACPIRVEAVAKEKDGEPYDQHSKTILNPHHLWEGKWK